MGPNTVIKRRMIPMSQCAGRSNCSGSTLSVGIVISLPSYRRLPSNTCDARSGRNGRINEPPAVLSMLPKFDDVPMTRYLIVLAKIRRPSATPSARIPRSFVIRTMSAASLATSVADSTEMPTSASCNATASFTPSPRNPTSTPVLRCSWMSRAFCSGEMRAKIVVPGSAAVSSGSLICASAVPVSVPATAIPRSRQTFCATSSLSPVTILIAMPNCSRRTIDAAASAFGGSAKVRTPAGISPSSSDGLIVVSPGASRAATAMTRTPAANWAVSSCVKSGGRVAHRARTDSGAPLTINRRCVPSSTRTDMRRRS